MHVVYCCRSTSKKKGKLTPAFILEKYHEYLEAHEECELRTGKIRKSLTYKVFCSIVAEGLCDEGSSAEVEPKDLSNQQVCNAVSEANSCKRTAAPCQSHISISSDSSGYINLFSVNIKCCENHY